MAFTQVGICNLALMRVGQSQFIESMDEATTAARVCNLAYEPSRDFVLRAFHWPFARETATLDKIADDPTDDWAYSYQMPADCIRAIRLVTGSRRNPARPPFWIAESSTGKVLYADENPAVLEYTKRYEDPTYFDADFASALAWYLASEIARPLARDASAGNAAAQQFQLALSVAAANAANEQAYDADPDGEYIRARGNA